MYISTSRRVKLYQKIQINFEVIYRKPLKIAEIGVELVRRGSTFAAELH